MKYTKLNIDDSAVPKIDPEKAAAAKAIDEKIAADAMKVSDRSGAASSASEEKSDKDEKVKTRTAQVPRPSVSGGTKLIAVVTGASSGLGSEFVHQIDRSSAERFDEIWVIARRLDRLEELRDSISTPVKILSFDLTKKSNLEAYSKELAKSGVVIGLLINAAGFGKIGSVKDIPLESIDSMIDLNCRAAVDMTQLSLPYMRAGSRIMEICSTAGFSPFPYLNVYAASKAFLLRYSRALREELIGDGIIVTAVCPYWIRDTEFIGTAKKTKGSKEIKSFPFSSTVHSVAVHALYDSEHGFAVSTPGIMCTVHRFFSKILPDTVIMGIWELLRRA